MKVTYTEESVADIVQAITMALEGFLEAAPDAIVVVDREGSMVILNTQAERLFKYAREDLLGMPVETLVPERFRGRHVDHRGEFLVDLRMHVERGRADGWSVSRRLQGWQRGARQYSPSCFRRLFASYDRPIAAWSRAGGRSRRRNPNQSPG